jgi:hypothetical protein
LELEYLSGPIPSLTAVPEAWNLVGTWNEDVSCSSKEVSGPVFHRNCLKIGGFVSIRYA